MVQSKISASMHGSDAQNLNYFCKIKANLNLTAPCLYSNHLFTVLEEKYQETVYKKNFEPRDPSDHLVWLPKHHGYRVAKMKCPLFLHFIHQHSPFLMVLYLAGFVAIIRTQGCLTYSEKGFSKILVNNLLLNLVCYEKDFFLFATMIRLWLSIVLSLYLEIHTKRSVSEGMWIFALHSQTREPGSRIRIVHNGCWITNSRYSGLCV